MLCSLATTLANWRGSRNWEENCPLSTKCVHSHLHIYTAVYGESSTGVRIVHAGRQGVRPTAAVRTSSPALWPRLQKPHLRSSRSSPLLLETVPLSSPPSLERGRFSPSDAITSLQCFGASGVEGRRSVVSLTREHVPLRLLLCSYKKSAFEFKK